jgi:hypothetical protein
MNWTLFNKRLRAGRYHNANYQQVILCHLATNDTATKDELVKLLEKKNPHKVKANFDFRSCVVFPVLRDRKHLIIQDGENFTLNTDLNNSRRDEIKDFCKALMN